MSGAYKSMLHFLDKSKKRPTALIGVNDIVVIGAINAIKEYG
jgi:DNA-binding LacI/PurR family transcriptional regulator